MKLLCNKAAAQRPPGSKATRVLTISVIIAGITILILGCERAGKEANSILPPTPETDPLAQPKSLQQVGLPVELTREAIPADNPQTPEKIALGQKLFFERRLSADGTISCSTCHDPKLAFTDRKVTSVGIKGRVGQRNSPTILNALYNKTQFWDGRAKTLEEQAGFPIVNPSEMGQTNLDAAVAQVASVKEYQQAFQHVFGRSPNGYDLLRAIASYERTQLSFDSPFDHFIAGDSKAIDASAKRGWELFNGQARCNKCHALTETQRDSTLFMDNDFHNIGIGIIRHNVVALAGQAEKLVDSADPTAIDRAAIQHDMSVLGRFLITKQEKDTASFKTPGMRNVLVTAPYFHDGSQDTLWDVMDHYNKGDGLHNPWLDEDIQPLALTETDIDDLVAFLGSLTSAIYKEQGAAELARQRALSRANRPQRDTVRAFAPKPTQPERPQ
jgi:cytochrome c peroxidase